MPISHPIEPITEDDDTLRAMLADAEIPALLVTVAQVTGDLSVLRPDLRPDPTDMLGEQGGLSPEQLADARELIVGALGRYRDGGCVAAPPPDAAQLRDLVHFAMGPSMDAYLPLLTYELALFADPDAPEWTKDEVAPDTDFSVLIVGAGMSGLAAAYRLEQAGIPYTIVEKNADVGGTWLENTYPGCRVDVPNFLYSFSFAQKDDWPQHYSTQDVLLDYFRDFADEFGLRKHVRFSTEVASAAFDEAAGSWVVTVRSADGGEEVLRAQALVSAVGQLNRPSLPAIPGLADFAGPSFHSAAWDADVDLTGKRVAVIGTGASALQFIPIIAPTVGSLTVFQRTPPWLAPTPDYHDPVAPGLAWLFRHVPNYSRWYRFWLFCVFAEGLLPATAVDPGWEPKDRSVSEANDQLRAMLTEYIAALVPGDEVLRDAMVPRYPPAAKRMLRDNGVWPATLQRENVELVTDGISRITAGGVVTDDGVEHEADVLIYATGFQAARFLTPMTVTGRGGADLHEQWDGDARAYLGITIPNFPNFFVLYGPNTNIVVNGSIIFFTEAEVGYLLAALRVLLDGRHRTMEVRRDVHDTFNERIDAGNELRSWGASTVNSWYKNTHGRVAQNWPFSLLDYWKETRVADPADYLLT